MKLLTTSLIKSSLSLSLVLVITIVSFLPLLQAGFVWDDEEFILGWESIRSLNSVPQLIQGELPLGHEGVYRPLRSITQALSYQLYAQNAQLYHLQALIIHLLSVVIVFILLLILTKQLVPTLIGSLFFSIHPLQSEAVSFISASFDTLGILWLLCSVLFFILSKRLNNSASPIYRHINRLLPIHPAHLSFVLFIVSIVFGFMANFTTELSFSLPLILFIFSYLYLHEPLKNATLKTIPYFINIAIYFLLRQDFVPFSMRMDAGNNLLVTYMTMTKAITEYMLRFFYPVPLRGITTIFPGITNVFATTEALQQQSLLDSKTVVGGGIIAIMFFFFILFWKRHRYISAAIALIVVAFLPVSNILPSHTIFAERYMYPVFIGIAFITAEVSKIFFKKVRHQRYDYLRGITTMVIIILFCLLGTRSFLRSRDYQTPITYWVSNLRYEPHNKFVLNNIGLSFASLGRFQDAQKAFLAALEKDRGFIKSLYNLSRVYVEQGKLSEAEYYARKSFLDNPGFRDYVTNYASVLAKQGKGREAQDVLATTAAQLKDSELAYFLGTVSIALNDYETAEDAYKLAISLNSTLAKAYIALGSLYNRNGTPSATVDLLVNSPAVLENDNLIADYNYTLATAQYKLNQNDEASESITRAFYANPDDKSIEALWNIIVLASPSALQENL